MVVVDASPVLNGGGRWPGVPPIAGESARVVVSSLGMTPLVTVNQQPSLNTVASPQISQRYKGGHGVSGARGMLVVA